MAQPRPVDRLISGGEPEETNEERVYTSSISVVGERGREIYVYLESSDTLEFKDLRPSPEPSYLRVEVDMNGHRHWSVHLSKDDSMETGRILPPPPPPPPGGGG